jgi:transglutaminase-like putative cysteine protease
MIGRVWPFLVALLLVTGRVEGKTLVVGGRLSSEVTVTQQVTFRVDRQLSELSYRFPLPARVAVPSVSQRVTDARLGCDPEPASVTEDVDGYGNVYKVITWRRLGGDVRATVTFTAAIDAVLDPLAAPAPFPPVSLPQETQLYLRPSQLVQSEDGTVVAKAAQLTSGAATESAAVEAVLNFVADHIRYETPPKSYDALFGLTTGTGNCQNFAHLACALLRASGIPARVAVGLTLKEKWKIPLDDHGSSLAQGMGEGLHAWIEVYYPGLGWLPYDPQQSKRFTSTRHIKYVHGPDCTGIGATWRGAPVAPAYDSVITSSFGKDLVDLTLKGSQAEPRGYITGNQLISAVAEPRRPEPVPVLKPVPRPEPPPLPKPPRPAEAKDGERPPLPPKKPVAAPPAKPDGTGLAVIGNTRFPATLSLYSTRGERGEVSLERETAEYVTSTGVYAQAFTLDRPLRLEQVSLAMKKFGGDGMLYIDLVTDDGGKPSLTGMRSELLPLERIRRSPGYGWVDFKLPSEKPLPPGKYWIVLRRSGAAIMNWYYTPGKPYGGPDDTRSTARGWQWEDILTYDFVFKVAGRVVRR